ncbi:MAG: pitrilysin family protein [Patescibacteria group bacterium]|nr:pitrilysin family protein [Patescibacteria group bacterium]MDD5716148.1 pitrilysin family protein [Patescibacteria group bacterium]
MFKKIKLKNGIRVILSPLAETKAVTVLVLIKVGSRYETRHISGASHFVEHLMFKGTAKRPSKLQISRELDGVGAEYNAFTAKDHTGYYIKTDYEKVELALDMLSDIVFHSKLDPAEMERERGVIIEEINMYEDNPLMYIDDLFEQTVFGDCPLGWNIAGPKKVIRNVRRADLLRYYRRHYRPGNALVAVAGRIDSHILDLIKKYFNQQPVRHNPSGFKKVHGRQQRPHVALKFKETEQVQLALGFPAYSNADPRQYALYLLSTILGGNMSSRLFMEIREKKGLCYFVASSVGVYQDTGTFVVQAGLDKTRLRMAISAILEVLGDARTNGVTKHELRKAKDYLKGRLVLQLEASDSVASWLAKQELLRDTILTPAQQIARLEKITLRDVQRAARDLFRTERLNLALIGPYRNRAEFRRLLRLPRL